MTPALTPAFLCPHDEDDVALAELNAARWETVLLPLSDGLTVLRKR